MVGVMRTERWTGIFHPVRILGLIEAASAAVDAHSLCWIAVTVWGFQDSPVSWSNQVIKLPPSPPPPPSLSLSFYLSLSLSFTGHPTQAICQRRLHTLDAGDWAFCWFVAGFMWAVFVQEHGFGIDGANHYTFVCLPSGRYIRMMALDPHDQAS